MRDQKRSDRKSLIQLCALRLIGAKGFQETTMADIAREAGLGTGTLYNYFPTKADLLLSIVIERAPDHMAHFPKAREELLRDRSLGPLLGVYLASFSGMPRVVWREILALGLSGRPSLMAEIAQLDAPFIAELEACLAALELGCTEEGRCRLARGLYRALSGSIVLWLAQDDADPAATPEALAQELVAQLDCLAGLNRP